MIREKHFKSMDGNTAAAYASYAFVDAAAIFPITPSSDMAQHIDEWATEGKKIFLEKYRRFWKCNQKKELLVLFMDRCRRGL